jgi:ABC-type Zn uptake system ZnuABC Zn-binding protein ZnuA
MLPVSILVTGVLLAAAPAPALRVVATIFPLADLVQQIGGSEVSVTTLLPGGANPHTYEPTPAQMQAVAAADLIVAVGAGLDTWLEKLLESRRTGSHLVEVTHGAALLPAAHEHEHDTTGKSGDPHIWVDPILVRDHVVGLLVEGLTAVQPERRSTWEAQAQLLRAQLTALDEELRTVLAPVRGKSYISLHSAWRYFGKRYGLQEAGVIEPFPGREPSAREIARMAEAARHAGTRTVLAEPQLNPRMAEQLAREIGGRVVHLDPFGAADLPGRNHYGELLRGNARLLAEALR